jgi:hypothetical protein
LEDCCDGGEEGGRNSDHGDYYYEKNGTKGKSVIGTRSTMARTLVLRKRGWKRKGQLEAVPGWIIDAILLGTI